MDLEYFIPSLFESKLADTSNVAVTVHMKTEVIIEHRFREEVKGSDQNGRQCGHKDDRAEEEGDDDGDNDDVS
ncbi:hypothetical protein AHAS_Ahas03G0118000 [Arachis hypogaea]